MTDEPSKIVTAIKLSKKTMKIVKENIMFAIFVKVLVLLLTALGITSMWWAVFADVGVSIIAIINSLRMLSKKI
jgi:Cd2+/Zn2+-exporting ATPase